MYRRIQLDKLLGLKRGAPSRAGPGAVAPLATLKCRPCLRAKFLHSLQCLGLMTVTSLWITQMHKSKTYLNSISCWNKWSHCFLCVYYLGLMVNKFLYPLSPVLCCLLDSCFSGLLKLRFSCTVHLFRISS